MSDADQVTPGFTLSRLVLRGVDVADATLEFTMGLNVISGPSNTGKSFAFWCIDYLLGAKTIKKSVAEVAPYHEGLLEIRATDGSFFTVRRDLDGATKLRWYSGRIQAVLEGDLPGNEDQLAADHVWNVIRCRGSCFRKVDTQFLHACFNFASHENASSLKLTVK